MATSISLGNWESYFPHGAGEVTPTPGTGLSVSIQYGPEVGGESEYPLWGSPIPTSFLSSSGSVATGPSRLIPLPLIVLRTIAVGFLFF